MMMEGGRRIRVGRTLFGAGAQRYPTECKSRREQDDEYNRDYDDAAEPRCVHQPIYGLKERFIHWKVHRRSWLGFIVHRTEPDAIVRRRRVNHLHHGLAGDAETQALPHTLVQLNTRADRVHLGLAYCGTAAARACQACRDTQQLRIDMSNALHRVCADVKDRLAITHNQHMFRANCCAEIAANTAFCVERQSCLSGIFFNPQRACPASAGA